MLHMCIVALAQPHAAHRRNHGMPLLRDLPQSFCRNLTGFRTVDTYPMRSPLVLADYLVTTLGKESKLAEVGTRNGDLSDCLTRVIKSYFAIEIDQRCATAQLPILLASYTYAARSYCRSLERRKIPVMCVDFDKTDLAAPEFLDINAPEFLDINAFFWFTWPPQLSEKWLRRIWKACPTPNCRTAVSIAHSTIYRGCQVTAARTTELSVFVAFDGHIPEDMRYLPLLADRYNGTIARLFFDEGGPITDTAVPIYAHPNLWRPGRWGTLHVARFRLGSGVGYIQPLPERIAPELEIAIHQRVRPDWSWQQFGWKAGQPAPSGQDLRRFRRFQTRNTHC